MAAGAEISECGRYRYRLWRVWDESRPVALFVMLNPSTADATSDDPTIRRCYDFANRWHMGGMVVVNLFAYRATDPNELLKVADPIGPRNNLTLTTWLNQNCRPIVGKTIAAWGNHKAAAHFGQAKEIAYVMQQLSRSPECFGRNKNGSPKHPLFLRKTTTLEPFGVRR